MRGRFAPGDISRQPGSPLQFGLGQRVSVRVTALDGADGVVTIVTARDWRLGDDGDTAAPIARRDATAPNTVQDVSLLGAVSGPIFGPIFGPSVGPCAGAERCDVLDHGGTGSELITSCTSTPCARCWPMASLTRCSRSARSARRSLGWSSAA